MMTGCLADEEHTFQAQSIRPTVPAGPVAMKSFGAPAGFHHAGDPGEGGDDAVPLQEPVPGRAVPGGSSEGSGPWRGSLPRSPHSSDTPETDATG